MTKSAISSGWPRLAHRQAGAGGGLPVTGRALGAEVAPGPLGASLRLADGVGARLGIEFFPWANINNLHEGLKLVEDAGHKAGGVIIDTWHIARADTPTSELASVPPDRIVGVELDDADQQVVGTLFEDTVHRRRYCGEGSFDLPGMVTALRTAGWNGPWGVEILSVEHRSLPVDEALRRAAASARHVLDQAASSAQ